MTPVERRAIEGAIRQCTATLERATQALAHLTQLLDPGTSAAPSRAPEAAAVEPAEAPLHPKVKVARRFEHEGKMLTILQLAEVAGCTECVMRSRLLVSKKSPAEAVAMGPADRFRRRPESGNFTTGSRPKTGAQHGRKTAQALATGPAPSPATSAPPPATTKTASSHALNEADWRAAKLKQDTRRVDSSAEAVVTSKTKITVAPPIPDRFAVDPATVPSTFGRIGQYEDTGSAVAKRYGGGGA